MQSAAAARIRESILERGERGTTALETIVTAAHEGRVDTLLVAENGHCWGSFDPATRTVARHEARQPGDRDLLDVAVTQTLRNKGRVIPMAPEALPDAEGAAALLRY